MSENHDIRVISSSTLEVESTARFSLTPWDLELLFLGYSQKGLLFRKPTHFHQSPLIHHLRSTLHRTLQFFLPLAARLATVHSHDGASTSFFVDCGVRGGALFIHATAEHTNLAVDDILHPPSNFVPGIVRSFFPLTGVRNADGVSQPLLGVQVTELVDGLFICCSINHMLADGTSFWHFFNSWAEISRDCATISKLPLLDRDRVNQIMIGSSTIPISNEHLKIYIDDQTCHINQMLSEIVFHFSKTRIAELKERLMAEAQGRISSLQAVMAHLWRSIIRCRLVKEESNPETTTFEIQIGARQRLNPPLPEEYFGNAVFPGTVKMESGEMLLSGPTGRAAWLINRVVASNDGPNAVTDFYTGWIKNPVFCSKKKRRNQFILINSPRFDVYGNDFGWGKPVAARSGGANRYDGKITVTGGPEEGSMEIVCIRKRCLNWLRMKSLWSLSTNRQEEFHISIMLSLNL